MVTPTEVQSLPDDLPKREAQILSWVAGDQGDFHMTEIDCGGGLVVSVFSDALKIGGVRINASARLEQQIADVYDCMLLTPLLADLVWANAVKKIRPFPLTQTAEDLQKMATTAYMLKESALIDKAASGAPAGILSTVGKHWVNTPYITPSKACNYGMHFQGTWTLTPSGVLVQSNPDGPANFGGMKGEPTVSNLGNVRVLQGPGYRHDPSHTDYSQTVVLVSRTCTHEGQKKRLSDILADAQLSKYVSTSPLSFDRQPGVPVYKAPTPVTPPKQDPPSAYKPPPLDVVPANLGDKPKPKIPTPPAPPPKAPPSEEPAKAGVGLWGVFVAALGALVWKLKAK